MAINTKLSKESFSNAILWLLLLLPLCFKIEFFHGLILYPQDILIPLILGLYFLFSNFRLSYHSSVSPYIFLLLALTIVLVSTAVSFIYSIEISGFLKVFKYLIYVIAIICVSDSIKTTNISSVVTLFNKVALLTISITLGVFIVGKVQSGVTWSDYFAEAMWEIEKMPTGFSNLVYTFSSSGFVKYYGNHGIYGSYLVLIYALNLGLLLDNRSFNRKRLSIVLVLLAVVNIGLLTSRETLLVFLVTNIGFLSIYLLSPRSSPFIKIGLLLCFALLVIGVVLYGSELTLIQKIIYTLDSFLAGNVESNVSLRFQVWKLTLMSFLETPSSLILGYGFNEVRYTAVLLQVHTIDSFSGGFVSVPESFFMTFLAYGGIISFVLSLMFFLGLTLKSVSDSALKKNLGKLLFFFIIGLVISNNTGASLLADLLMTQLGIIFIWYHKVYKNEEQSERATHFS